MLEDLSLHVLDIAENSAAAGAASVTVEITEDEGRNILSMAVEDDGIGMAPDFEDRAADPFVTTKAARRTGMGLSFLKQSAELCGGKFAIRSELGKGTRTEASFAYDSIDRPPIGDIPATVMLLFVGRPEINWKYVHRVNGEEFSLSTEEILRELEDRDLLRTPEAAMWIRNLVAESLEELRGRSGSVQLSIPKTSRNS